MNTHSLNLLGNRSQRRPALPLFLLLLGLTLPAHAAEPSPSLAPEADGFIRLFNGHDLQGWDGDLRLWSVQNGAIVGETTPTKTTGGTYLFCTAVAMTNFELHLKYRLPSGNSGIQYRSRQLPNWQVAGYQADMDEANAYTGILYEVGGRGITVNRGEKVRINAAGKKTVLGSLGDPKQLLRAIKPHDWNDYTVRAQGDHLMHIINGHVMVDVVDDYAQRINGGRFAFQLHPGPPMRVEFKEIRVKSLPTESH